MVPKIEARLVFTDLKITHKEVSDLVAVIPTSIWRKNDLLGKTGKKWKTDGWKYVIDSHESYDICDILRLLLERVRPDIDSIRDAARNGKFAVEVSCTAYVEDEMPSISITPEILGKISAMNASLDIDIIA